MPHFFHGTFDDVDVLASTSLKWDVEFLQLSSGPFHGEVKVLQAGSMLIQACRFNQHLRIVGDPPKGYRTFTLLAENSPPQFWRGRTATETDLMLYPVDGEVDSVTRAGFGAFSLSVTNNDLERALKRLDLAKISRQFKEKEIFPVSMEAMARIRQEFRRIFALYSNNGSKPLHPQQERSLADHLLDHLLVALSDSNQNHFKIRRRKRENAIAQAEKYIKNHGHQPISVVSLSEAAGVSKRTLQYSFQERFGVSPLQYLKAFRLRMVRRELVEACPSKASVSDLAGRVGFGHLGQFAADYKRHFGELPSHTLLLRG